MGGNGFGDATGEVGNDSVGDLRVLEVTDVEPEHLSHACKQCLSEAEMVARLDKDVESETASVV